jgi:hypothetical protein
MPQVSLRVEAIEAVSRLPPGTDPSRRRSMRVIARSCLPLRFGALRSADFRLDWVGSAPAPCDSGSSRNLRDYESAPTYITLSFMDQNPRIYAAGLSRTRNSAARNRPQRRQRQRRFAWSTLRLSGVRKWPLPQIPGMAMDSTAAGLFAFAEEIPRARWPGSPPDARSRHRVADQISVGQHTA